MKEVHFKEDLEIFLPHPNYPIYLIGTRGTVINKYGRKLKPNLDKDGYKIVSFFINKVEIKKKVHRLVAETFIENKENKPMVNHKNCIKTDNSIENLEWCTNRENINHAYINGRLLCGEDNPNSKLKEEDVLFILENKGIIPFRKLAKMFNVTSSSINSIYRKKSWRKVSEKFHKSNKS